MLIQNRVRETSTSIGNGSINLDGAIDPTYIDFVTAFGDNKSCFYTIVNLANLEYEIGKGVVHAGTPNTLTRSAVIQSSNSNSLVTFSAGPKYVFNSMPAELFTTTPTADLVPIGDANHKLDNGWLKNTIGYDFFNTVTYSGSLSIDMNNGSRQFITLTGNPTLTLANTSANGDVFTLAFKQDGVGSRTVTWFSGITWPGGAPVQPTATANSISYFDFIRMADGTIYYRPIIATGGGGGGGGGVDGPMATTVDAIAVWDDTTGTLLRNSLVNIHAGSNDKLEYLASFGAVIEVDGSDPVITLDLDLGNCFYVPLEGNRNIGMINASVGQHVWVVFQINFSAPVELTWVDNIIWDAWKPPTLGYAGDDWNSVELLCFGVDAYSNPLFIEISRRGTNNIDSVSKHMSPGYMTGTLTFPYYDIYFLSGSCSLTATDNSLHGRIITFIADGGTTLNCASLDGPNGSAQDNPIVFSGSNQSITLLANGNRWVMIGDTRTPQFCTSSYTSTSTVDYETTLAQVPDGTGSITLTLRNGYRGKMVVIQKLGTGSVTVKNIGATTLAQLDFDNEVCFLVYNSGWTVLLDTQSTGTGGNISKILYSKAYAAAADQITNGSSANVLFNDAGLTVPSGYLAVVGRRLILRASGTWDSNSTSGSLSYLGFNFHTSGGDAGIGNLMTSLVYNSTEIGYWSAELEIVVQSSTVFVANSSAEINKLNSQALRSGCLTTSNGSLATTIRVFANATSALKMDLRTFTIEGG